MNAQLSTDIEQQRDLVVATLAGVGDVLLVFEDGHYWARPLGDRIPIQAPGTSAAYGPNFKAR